MQFDISPLRTIDSLEIIKLESVCFPGEPERALYFLDMPVAAGLALKLKGAGEEISGFVIYSSVVDEGEILLVAVHPDLRGQGLGKFLMQKAFSDMKNVGAKKVFLEVRKSNTAAKALYVSLKAEQIAERKDYYLPILGDDKKENALVFSFDLTKL